MLCYVVVYYKEDVLLEEDDNKLRRMKTHLKILSLFIVFSGVLMKSGDVFEGTVGEKVEIKCPYPDDYKFTPKYLCRHPCGSEHVLIKSAKIDQVDQNGRYSLINTVSGRFFTVTIKDLRLKDSGVYYCGLDQWFRDTLKKVNLSVRQAAPVNRPSHTPENTIITTTAFTWTTTLTSAVVTSNNSTSYEQFSSTVRLNESKNGEFVFSVTVVCAGVLVLLVFVALVFLYRKRSDSKSRCLNHPVPENSVQTVDDVFHIYDEMLNEYSLDASSSVIYSTVQQCNPAPQDDFYSLITHH
ncbi:CMRF35-like molecule 5 isoform X1 [Megalobrama amblycephala]|uniref:CMRF35-like molecule 5 isoform X1 n=1 Tax=Megalobrama amblycephala TaxID=75352 RepID=UPI0020140995|nr:CMRF35-like molecule 5 isoform X1 [Megalobrama amblycephala]